MLNKKLQKSIEYHRSKCWEYHNRMKFANPIEMGNFQYQYNKHNTKYNELKSKIESDGKHKIMMDINGQMRIDKAQ
jgi:hypothetical protein